MSGELEDFYEVRTCAKCKEDSKGITYKHYKETDYIHPENCMKRIVTPEHLMKTCTRCGYSWKEKPYS